MSDTINQKILVADKWDQFATCTAKRINWGEIFKIIFIPGYSFYTFNKIAHRRNEHYDNTTGEKIVQYTLSNFYALGVEAAKAYALLQPINLLISHLS